jgi:hypothetical protein
MGTKSKAKGKPARETASAGAKAKETSSSSARETSAAARSSSSRMVAAKPVADDASEAKPEAKPKKGEGKTKLTKAEQAAAAAAAAAAEANGEDGDDPDRPKRALGLRGAAPWAARHAAKHAAEARKRAAEPPPPGSARATIRTPTGVDEIKQHVAELHNNTERIKTLRKNLAKTFFDIGVILREIQTNKLYAAKGFQSFESFVEREVDLGKTVSARLVKLVGIFQREAALEMGMDKAIEALIHLEGGPEASQPRESDSRMPVAKPAMPTSTTRGPIVGRLRLRPDHRGPTPRLIRVLVAPVQTGSLTVMHVPAPG